ncbi:nucleotide exchange factor GrpE [Clostridium algidicarnis]|uniref:nucleotide exchange factor GrpE n=1 Tax=Clostridium algidicarnis TaxID=37659 RepID=UPI0016263293|nr:nucleotide exchange factor GrpE [Clostridium algidicarnis]MBB6696370.1 nucleotide exchange factor GrpE [Clostridium algidicarnis]MBU3193589.1 nucleotide exchange factor GrpE [Clostridium algidicarnis]MBU3203005.1 nucleotide exchange factor GrpE [Clostridium algidicarnis]MBU3205696.1 nucleotide exchange factor GrpE [Clostridium algidicarnis]MBU3211159.1 nucleotide exchange factor GrpE [Clostridium algidicarnis]
MDKNKSDLNPEEKVENLNLEDENVKEESSVVNEPEILEKEEYDNIVDLKEFSKYKDEALKTKEENNELQERLLRVTAEYENYRKRTTKEKESIYGYACEDVLKNILPVLDNLERAALTDGSAEDIKKGVEITLKQFKEALEKLQIEEIDTNSGFDPNMHDAVMHVVDESLGEKEIIEVFQKGYKKGDKVIRYSVVKVAN